MSIDRPANERLKLYERFKQSLAEGSDADFFDADDLVIIIDQAVDLEDEYVQIEALMRGYRFFPDNAELKNRRAFLYYDLNLDAGVKDMLDVNHDASPMWEILKVRSAAASAASADADFSDKARKMLSEILVRYDKFDDETVIQFVDCAADCGLFDWLVKKEKALRSKTDYLPSLLYELFVVADGRGDSAYSLRLLEELTEIEPFNIDFWNALAQTQSSADNLAEALSATDYALAIDSDNAMALTLRASVLIRMARYAEALEIIDQLIETDGSSALLCELKVRALYGMGDTAAMLSALDRYVREFPADSNLINLALYIMPVNIGDLLQKHYVAIPSETRRQWQDLAHVYYTSGKLREAAAMLYCALLNEDLSYHGLKMLATCYYCGKDYKAALALLRMAIDEPEQMLLIPDVVIGGILASLRLDGKRKTKQLYREVLQHFPLSVREDWTMSSVMQKVGFTSLMGLLNDLLEQSGRVDVEEIDIFNVPRYYDGETEED